MVCLSFSSFFTGEREIELDNMLVGVLLSVECCLLKIWHFLDDIQIYWWSELMSGGVLLCESENIQFLMIFFFFAICEIWSFLWIISFANAASSFLFAAVFYKHNANGILFCRPLGWANWCKYTKNNTISLFWNILLLRS